MKSFFLRLNNLAIFDVARLPCREAIMRSIGIAAVTVMFALRLLQIPRFPGLIRDVEFLRGWFSSLTFLPARLAPRFFDLETYYRGYQYSFADIRLLWGERALVWCLESAILAGYVLAWLTRDRAKEVARGFMQVVFPLLLGGLPFAIVMTEYTFETWMPASARAHLFALGAITLLLVLGETLNVVGLITLRRSFTIMAEARTLVRGGIYRFIRHPLYAGQFITYLGYTLLHVHAATVALYICFVAAQVLRARIEERKLAAAFPEYEEYRRTTGMFLPWQRRYDGAP